MSEIGLYDAMSSLRAVRYLKPDPISDDVLQRVLQAANKKNLGAAGMILEINPSHPILKQLNELRGRGKPREIAKEVTEQLLDNAMITAGLLVDPRALVERSTRLMERALAELKSE